MDRIVAGIKRGELTPGDPLPSERELMGLYSVGRPAIREALQYMSRIGLIALIPGERARVASPSYSNLMQTVALTTSGILHSSDQSLEELKEARLLFEMQMVKLATERATEEDIARLDKRHRQHLGSLSDLSQFQHHDMMFHREIAQITRNSIFPALSEALIGWLGEFYQHLVRLKGAEEITLTEHEAILNGVKSGDPALAETAMRAHLTRANSLYLRLQQNRTH